MAQKAIREYFGKRLLFEHLPNYFPSFKQEYQGVSIDYKNIDEVELPDFSKGYVAKPDDLFGKRGKNKLIHANKNPKKTLSWVKGKLNSTVKVKNSEKDEGIEGVLSTFIIEPFIPHEEEYYLAFKTEASHDVMHFSIAGGVEIEANWDQVASVNIPYQLKPKSISGSAVGKIKELLQDNPNAEQIIKFISGVYLVFHYLDFTYLEMNPFTLKDGQLYILDLVARLDDTALHNRYSNWTAPLSDEEKIDFEFFPSPFGTKLSESEKRIQELDARSGAALKFSVINPDGKIWLLTSGGGGSIIFADTVGDLGYAKDLANYCDYSGNPTTDETQEFTEIFLGKLLQSKSKDKVVVITGGIANFTDIKATFKGVVNAIKTLADDLKKQNVRFFVRRGGPNYKQGLKYIEEEVTKLDIFIEVHGPEMFMTDIIKLALADKKK